MADSKVPGTGTMIDRMALAIAKADGHDLATNPERYRRLALAALQPLTVPTEAMVDAAHQAVWFDAEWAINSRRDFRRAVRAMIAHAIAEAQDASRQGSSPRTATS